MRKRENETAYEYMATVAKALAFTSGTLNDNAKINGFSIFHVMIFGMRVRVSE